MMNDWLRLDLIERLVFFGTIKLNLTKSILIELEGLVSLVPEVVRGPPVKAQRTWLQIV